MPQRARLVSASASNALFTKHSNYGLFLSKCNIVIVITVACSLPSTFGSLSLTNSVDLSASIALSSVWGNCGTQSHLVSGTQDDDREKHVRYLVTATSNIVPLEIVTTGNGNGSESVLKTHNQALRQDMDTGTVLDISLSRFTPSCKLFLIYGTPTHEYWEIEHLRQISNTKRDYFVFIGSRTDLMNKVFESRSLANGVKYKVGLDIATGEILYQPNHFVEPLLIHGQLIPKPDRVNLRNRPIRATAGPIPPFIQKVLAESYKSAYLSSKKFFGSTYEPIYVASQKYNFTIELDFGRKAQGIKYPNGSWDGVSGEVVRRESDVALLLAQDLDRYDSMDLTGSHFGIFKIGFTTVQPLVSVHPEALVYPYEKHVWALIVLSILAITPLFHAYFKYDGVLQRRCDRLKIGPRGQRICRRVRRDDLWWNAVSISFKIATEQDIPKRLSLRLRPLTALWMWSLIIITTGYKSNLLTFLTLPYEEQLPDSFPSLATKYADFEIYYHDVGGTDFRYFNKRQSDLARRLRDRFILEKDISRCMVKSLTSSTARKTICMGWATLLSQIVARNLTLLTKHEPLRIVEDGSPFTASAVMGLQKNSIFTDAINFIGASFYEAGLSDLWRAEVTNVYKAHGKAWMHKHKNGETKLVYEKLRGLVHGEKDTRSAFGLKHFKVVFGALLVGCGLAFLVFMVEYVFGKVN